ncbi:MAG: thiolase family protein [Deltaproteobacteria bacterium]|nr:thiolase family protein [Deltaproteobacteria bacterium]
MRPVYVVGIGMTPFGKHLDKSIKELTTESVRSALDDAGLVKEDLQAAWFANSTWGFFTEQNFVRGQVAFKGIGLQGIPIINVENACGGGATALHSAWLGVASGLHECALAVGTEKLWHEDKTKSFRALLGGSDLEELDEFLDRWKEVGAPPVPGMPPEVAAAEAAAEGNGSPIFTMDLYAHMTRGHMKQFGTTQRQVAKIASKNHYHGSLNPLAMYRKEMTVDEILAGRAMTWPVTVPMCAPISDGSAAAIVCSGEFLKRAGRARPVKILASVVGSHTPRPFSAWQEDAVRTVSRKAYDLAGVGPEDMDLAEVHDASAFGELRVSEGLGFCEPGGGGPLAESGATTLGGRIPINVSGGLASRGHPLGATGVAQIYELVTQLRGEAGRRQVEGARLGIAENGGGFVYFEEASMHVHILEKVPQYV